MVRRVAAEQGSEDINNMQVNALHEKQSIPWKKLVAKEEEVKTLTQKLASLDTLESLAWNPRPPLCLNLDRLGRSRKRLERPSKQSSMSLS